MRRDQQRKDTGEGEGEGEYEGEPIEFIGESQMIE